MTIDADLWQKVKNGMRLPFRAFGLQERPEELVAIFYQEQLISIYKAHDKYHDMMKPVKVIRTEIGE